MSSSSRGSSSEEGSGRTSRTSVAGETPAEREFWERYWEVLRIKGVKAGQERWYERSCAQFIRVWKPRRLREATAKRPKRLPVVLTREEVRRVLNCMRGEERLMARLLYGSGLRLMECLRLRVQDVEYVFPADRLSVDPRSGRVRRHHACENTLQLAVSMEVRKASIPKAATCHMERCRAGGWRSDGGVGYGKVGPL